MNVIYENIHMIYHSHTHTHTHTHTHMNTHIDLFGRIHSKLVIVVTLPLVKGIEFSRGWDGCFPLYCIYLHIV